MKQWEIYTYDPGFGPHPAVIISHPHRVANKPDLEVLLCSTQRASRAARETEVLLDDADGLDWETLCKCDLILSASKAELRQKRGQVTPDRRRQIVSTIIRSHDWSWL
jgi:mRNA-degrading endonuclease toxin of MazEF toxin-antitoxin module